MPFHIVYGPVFSGKTEWLQQKYSQVRLREQESKMLWVAPTSLNVPHNGTYLSSYALSFQNPFWVEARTIFWDDAHQERITPEMLEDLRKEIDNGKTIYMTSWTHPNDTMCDLMPFAETVQLFHSAVPHETREDGSCASWVWSTQHSGEQSDKTEVQLPPLGKFTLIVGPMFSGKTTKLLSIARRLASAQVPLLLVNHSMNERYGTNRICTHSRRMMNQHEETSVSEIRAGSCADVQKLLEAEPKWRVICLDEIQFFADAVEWVPKWMEQGFTVLAAGLSGDAKRYPFGPVCKLLRITSSLIHLQADCQWCIQETPAPFTRVKPVGEQKKEQIEVGGEERYEAVCRFHFNKS